MLRPIDMKKYIIVDIDGTIAKRTNRGPYDMSKVLDDEPQQVVVNLVHTLYTKADYGVIFVTGRDYSAEKNTRLWLDLHAFCKDYLLFMRGEGDQRPDDEIKLLIYNEFIKPHYDVAFVIDDRMKVVKMWREQGLTCLQVDYGDF